MTVPPHHPPVDDEDDVLAGLTEVVHRVTERPELELRPELRFVDDLAVDSLAMVEILEGTSARLGVVIPDEAAKGFVRVGDLLDHLRAQTGRPRR